VHRLRGRRFSTQPLYLLVLALAACDDPRPAPPTGLDLTAMEPGADPCQDFYQYACGGWIASHPLDASASFVTRFDDPLYAMEPILEDILAKDAAGMVSADDPEGQLVGRYYQGCFDAPGNVGARQSLAPMLAAIDAIQSLDDLAAQAAAQRLIGSGTFFSSGVITDVSDPSHSVVSLDQGGFELARYHYVDPTEASTLAAYERHIMALASFFPTLSIDAAQVLQIETALANAALDPDDRGDPRTLHHRMSLEDVAALAPTFPWSTYWQARGFGGTDTVDVAVPGYLTAMDNLLRSTPLPTLKMYMEWQLIEDKAARLDAGILDEEFNFWGVVINEVSSPPPRAWTCYLDTQNRFGMSLSKPYIARHYGDRTSLDMRAMIEDLRSAFSRRIAGASWLDPETRAAADEKLAAVAGKVGYPNRWPTLDALSLSGAYVDYDLQIDAWASQRALAGLTLPVDHGAWTAAPITVNAFYSAGDNAITIPAGIMQLPFFGDGYSSASNYGGIGVVLGHELTHGFDDSGRLFDGSGLLSDWWTPATAAAFSTRSQCVVDQYASYQVLPGVSVDGQLTLPENLADLGGVNLAYDAWMARGQHEGSLGGLDDRQQFFVSFAQSFCENASSAYLQFLVSTNPHSPPRQRVNGALANVPAAAQAFACAPGTPLAPANPCSVW
jgi:endothelin-converting enzyme/putative endopeptidase